MAPPYSGERNYDAYIRVASQNFGVPFALIKAIIGEESAYNPRAFRPEPAIADSSSGLMQILYSTAKGEGYGGPVGSATNLSGLYDPATNITYGTSYLADCLRNTGGNVAGAISAYNGGYRPELGFGERATKPVRICLARDTNKQCIRWRDVRVGEYANQDYVNKVLNAMAYYERQAAETPTIIPNNGVIPHPLSDAHQPINESETGGHTRRAGHRTLEPQAWWHTLAEIIRSWFKRQ